MFTPYNASFTPRIFYDYFRQICTIFMCSLNRNPGIPQRKKLYKVKCALLTRVEYLAIIITALEFERNN